MFTKRIIPCLDVNNGRVVKGVNFVDLKDAGDPVEIAKAYDAAGADELVFLDITASHEGRKTFTELVKRIAANINIPFTVGGKWQSVCLFRLQSAGESAQWKILKHCFARGQTRFPLILLRSPIRS